MPTLRRTVLISRLAACVLMVGAAALPALGQQGLDDKVTTQARLTDDDVRQIQQYADKYKDQLRSEDPSAVKVARNHLIEPLVAPEVSVDFRLRYTLVLLPVLEPLLRHERDLIASNAARILGELGTPRAVDQIVQVFADKRPAVRYSATYAAQRVFDNLMPPRSAVLSSEQASRFIDAIAARMGVEDDANVVQGLVLALQAASSIPSTQLKDIRTYAVASAARSVAARAKAMDGKSELTPGWRSVFWRASGLTRTALTQAPPNEPRLTPEGLKQAGGLAGQTLALVRRRVQAGVASPDEREMLAKIAALAEATYYFAHSAMGGESVKEYQFGPMLTANEDAKFVERVLEIIGPNGALTSQPFGFADTEFVR